MAEAGPVVGRHVLLQDQDSVLGERKGSVEIHESATECLLEIHGVEPYLAGNLLFIAHWHEEAQRRIVHDVAGYFTPDRFTPLGVVIPPNSRIGMLNELDQGKFYNFHVRSDQIVNILGVEARDGHFNAGSNLVKWPR